MPIENIGTLNSKYLEADTIDGPIFAEQRSNIKLILGDHYNRKTSRHLERLRSTKQLSNQIKLRLTKNHISRIIKIYINNILNQSPGVTVVPKNEKEAQDRKAAELNLAVWEHIKKEHRIEEKISQYCSDYIGIGEAFVKITWDADIGAPVPIEDTIDADTGEIVQRVQMVPGNLSFERIFGFNLLRDPGAKSFDEARWVIHRKMVDKKELQSRFDPKDPRYEYIVEAGKDTYTVFEGQGGSYDSAKNKVMVREFYFRPCSQYPQGYYFITTEKGILHHGELPLGLFPILHAGFDEVPTSPRSRSIIKQLRPYQAEINRAASKMAEHQVTLGDDKILIQSGTKIAPGGQISGVRGIQYSGIAPQILQGRSGAQYLEYMNSQIQEMYKVANIFEETEEKQMQLDPYALLFRRMREKLRFSTYAEKFERLLIDICKMCLSLYKAYAIEQLVIPAIGREEIVNMPEFKSSEDIRFQIKIEPRTDDMVSQLGGQMAFSQMLQYAGDKLSPEAVGKIAINMPFINDKEIFSELTMNYENLQNVILAVERGEDIQVDPNDDHIYMAKHLRARTRKADFKFLAPEIQQKYEQIIQQHNQINIQQQQMIQAAQAGFIPSGGPLIGVDFFVNYDPVDPSKSRRARVPSESIQWLIDKLNQQGTSQEVLSQLDQSQQAELAASLLQAPRGTF